MFAAAETILAHAASALDQRTSGQAGLFGANPAEAAPIRLPRDASWTLAQRMAAERDAFGFYFSAHPVDCVSAICSPRTRFETFAELAEIRVGRRRARRRDHGGLVEDARWRTSAKGRRYMMATLSDSSGQFVATVFDDEATAALEAAAKAGQCGLLDVELDRRAGDETPRVTIKRFQPLSDLAKRTRLADDGPTWLMRQWPTGSRVNLTDARGGNGIVRFIVPIGVRR